MYKKMEKEKEKKNSIILTTPASVMNPTRTRTITTLVLPLSVSS